MKPRTSRKRPPLSVLYALLVVIMLAQGVWWVVYLSSSTSDVAEETERRLAAERQLAIALIRQREIPVEILRTRFPDLVIEMVGDSLLARVDPTARSSIHGEALSRRRMVAFEGSFFLVLLALGSLVLLAAHRKERDYRRAHELFLAGVTHEFRTPLANVRLSAETLDRADLDERATRDVRRRLLEGVERLQTLVGQVLAVTRHGAPSTGDPGPLDVGETARRVVDELRPLATSQGARLEIDLPTGYVVHADADAFTLALRNILVNALEHGRRNGSAPTVAVRLRAERGRLRLSVSDDGPGIDRQELPQMFRAFRRGGGGSHPGAGLGLYLARRGVESMGGVLDADSAPGEGATFTIELPEEERS